MELSRACHTQYHGSSTVCGIYVFGGWELHRPSVADFLIPLYVISESNGDHTPRTHDLCELFHTSLYHGFSLHYTHCDLISLRKNYDPLSTPPDLLFDQSGILIFSRFDIYMDSGEYRDLDAHLDLPFTGRRMAYGWYRKNTGLVSPHDH